MNQQIKHGLQARGSGIRRVIISAAVYAMFASPLAGASDGAAKPIEAAPIKSNRVILIDATKAGKRLVAVGERGVVLYSDDDGAQWIAQRTPVTRTLTTVAFSTDKIGVAVGHGGSILRTEDGGGSWNKVDVAEVGKDSLLGLTHLGGSEFIAYGAFGLFLASKDDGKTWERKSVVNQDFDRHIMAVVASGNFWFLAAESGNIARSKDRGVTWEALKSPYVGSFFGAVVTKDGAILAFGMRGNVWRSTDQGTTWVKIETNTKIGINGGRVLEDGTVVLVGNTGLILTSTDNGGSFKISMAPQGMGYATVVPNGKGELVAAGEAGVSVLAGKLWGK